MSMKQDLTLPLRLLNCHLVICIVGLVSLCSFDFAYVFVSVVVVSCVLIHVRTLPYVSTFRHNRISEYSFMQRLYLFWFVLIN